MTERPIDIAYLSRYISLHQPLSSAYVIKIMPCAESEANPTTQGPKFRAEVVVVGRESDLSPSTQGMVVFLHLKSFVHLPGSPCTLAPFATLRLELVTSAL